MLLAVTVLFTACGSDDEAQTVSFDKSVYALTDGSVSVTLGANFTPGQAQDYPVTFGGTAVKDKDTPCRARNTCLEARRPSRPL